MSRPVPDPLFPPQANCKVRNTGLATGKVKADEDKEKDDKHVPTPVLTSMVVAALKTLHEPQGSTVMAVRRLLASEKHISEHTDLRPAFILGLKRGIIQRPPEAVQAGIYGLYVAPEKKRKLTKFEIALLRSRRRRRRVTAWGILRSNVTRKRG